MFHPPDGKDIWGNPPKLVTRWKDAPMSASGSLEITGKTPLSSLTTHARNTRSHVGYCLTVAAYRCYMISHAALD